MGNRLEGRVAIVTGAGRGIGRGVAHQLAEEGCAVVVNDFGGALDGSGGDIGPADEVVNEIRAAGGQAAAHYGDISKFEDCAALAQTAMDEFGRLDILCHVAGILRDRMVFNMTEEEWDAVLAVHRRARSTRCATRWVRCWSRDTDGSFCSRPGPGWVHQDRRTTRERRKTWLGSHGRWRVSLVRTGSRRTRCTRAATRG